MLDAGNGGSESVELIDPYMAMVRERVCIEKPLSVAVDAGNGVAGPVPRSSTATWVVRSSSFTPTSTATSRTITRIRRSRRLWWIAGTGR